MKAFSLALIVLAILGADFAADAGWVQMSANDAQGWATVDTLGILYAGWWFWREGRQR